MNDKKFKYNIEIIYPCDATFGITRTESDEIEDDYILEEMFKQWNHGSNQECEQFLISRNRSLSVNDIININGRYYQCLSYGWKRVSEGYVRQLESDVMHLMMNDPEKYDAYFALNEVMYQRYKAEALGESLNSDKKDA